MPDELDGLMRRASEPHAWQEVARDYLRAANYLLDWHDLSREMPAASAFEFTHHGFVAPIMVLYAIAVENLLKALRVAHQHTPVVDGKLSSHFKHHKLLSHAREAGLTLSEAESDLLEHLGDFIEAGRYPVPVAEGNTPRAWQFTFPRDVEAVWLLLERLECALEATGQVVLPRIDVRERHRPPGYALS